MIKIGSGLSLESESSAAAQDALGKALGPLGGLPPTLAFVFVSPAHAGSLGELAGPLSERLGGAPLLGCTAQAVVGEDREVETSPAFSVWAAHLGNAEMETLWLSMEYTSDGPSVIGLGEVPDGAKALLLLAEPHSFPTQALLTRLNEEAPGLPVIGGQASGGGPGENVLVLGGETRRSGAAGVFLKGDVSLRTVVSQGCRPIGSPYIITHGQRNVIEMLAGRPPLERVGNLAAKASPQEQEMIRNSLQIGMVIDEQKVDPQRGDFLIRPIVNADFETGAIAIGDLADVGRTVQFQLRDAATADEDLKSLLASQAGGSPAGALMFTCNGRGMRLFGAEDHDVKALHEAMPGLPVAGMFCAGEIGPIGNRNFLHGFTASIALFGEDADRC